MCPPFHLLSLSADFRYQRYVIGSHPDVEFLISYKRNSNMAGARTCEVGVPLAALHLES
jgi:hypothetical protein